MLENLQMARPGGKGRGRRRHDVGARRTRQHDPQAAATARPHVPAGPGRSDATASAAKRRAGPARRTELGELRQDQQALREQLNKLLEELRQRGLGQPGQRASRARAAEGGEMDQLGSAGEAMGDAEGELGDGNADGAVDARAARSKRCARARRAWRNRCSSKPAWARAPASPAAGRAAGRSRIPIRSDGPCAAAITATTSP